MHVFRLALAVSAIAVVTLLTGAGPADAAGFFRGRSAPAYQPDSDHMPGWDWERTYPWSPYNYGRNPYNPIILPYPPNYYAYPPYRPAPLYGPHNAAAPDGAMFPSSVGQPILMPHPSGVVETPPPGAAIIQVRVPEESAHVLFDGERTYTEGTTRYFVTPELPEGKSYHYTVTASWLQDGAPATKERKIQVTAGHTTVVDFVHPAGK